MLNIGSVVDGKYKVLSEIGHGGMSVVYLAINERANKTWAIKEVRKDGGNDSEVVSQNLIAETEMLKKLSHKHLPSIIDVIDNQDSFLIVMDYIEGKSLESIVKHSGPQSKEQVIEWAKQLCDVLDYLHGRTPPIIYRDMKPGNVMLKPDGNVTLIDFGTAREYKAHRTEDTISLGTHGYAAPEQYGGKGQTDARTDVYCLGATMYHLLTGHAPQGAYVGPVGDERPDLMGSGIEAIIIKCCQTNPADRYQTCAELLTDLENEGFLNRSVIHKRNIQWGVFLASVATAVVFGFSSLGFHLAENNATTETYTSYLNRAKTNESDDEMYQMYRQALKLKPSSVEAYNDILSAVLQDNTFSVTENTRLQECILDTDGGTKTNLDYLKTADPKGYAQFVFSLAHSYYFYYEGSDNRAKAANWYKEVKDDPNLDNTKRNLANALYTIGSYYASLDSDRSIYSIDENSGNYLTFWNQMVEITDGDLNALNARTGGTQYSVALYKEFATQIYNRTSKFMAYGVPAESMYGQLDKIQTGLNAYTPRGDSVDKNVNETQEVLNLARSIVESTYAVVGEH